MVDNFNYKRDDYNNNNLLYCFKKIIIICYMVRVKKYNYYYNWSGKIMEVLEF